MSNPRLVSLAGLVRSSLLLELLGPDRDAFLQLIASPVYETALSSDAAFATWLRDLLEHDESTLHQLRVALADARASLLGASAVRPPPSGVQ